MADTSRRRIEKIRLYRFQSYVDNTIELDAKTTAIVGRTDAGKSAITRALYWVLYNKPLRVDYTMWGEKHCFVTVTFSDGVEITRGRKNTENYYVLKDIEGNSETFKGFGAEVPPKVMEAHGMYLLHYVDGNDTTLNISCQLDPVFMLEESATRRAKAVGIVSGADKVDGGVMKVNGWLKEANEEKKDLTKRISDITKHLESYAYLDNLEVAITSLSNLLRSISSNESFYSNLLTIFTSLKGLEVQREEMRTFLAFEEKYISLEDMHVRLSVLESRRNTINNTYGVYAKLLTDKRELYKVMNQEPLLSTLADHCAKISGLVGDKTKIESLFVEYASLERQIASLTIILGNVTSLNSIVSLLKDIDEKVHKITKLKNVYDNYLLLQERIFKGNNILSKLGEDLSIVTDKYYGYLNIAGECPFCNTALNRR